MKMFQDVKVTDDHVPGCSRGYGRVSVGIEVFIGSQGFRSSASKSSPCPVACSLVRHERGIFFGSRTLCLRAGTWVLYAIMAAMPTPGPDLVAFLPGPTR